MKTINKDIVSALCESVAFDTDLLIKDSKRKTTMKLIDWKDNVANYTPCESCTLPLKLNEKGEFPILYWVNIGNEEPEEREEAENMLFIECFELLEKHLSKLE